MKNKNLKRVIASLSAITMLASASAVPVNVFAGEQLGHYNFEEGIGVPWRISQSGPANLSIDFSDGKYIVEINNPGGKSRGGEDRWDAQLLHSGLYMDSTHTYKLTYTVSSDTDGYIYSVIGNDAKDIQAWHGNGKVTIEGGPAENKSGDVEYGQGWELLKIGAGDTITVTAEFQPKETVENAVWAFEFGGDGLYGNGKGEDCFPAGTKLSFSNLSLTDLTSDEHDWPEEKLYGYKDISVNQLGYISEGIKQATYAPSNGKAGRYRQPEEGKEKVTFSLMKDGKEVYTGSASSKKDTDSGNYTYVLDFSEYKTEGTGYTVKVGEQESYPFTIGSGSDIYKGLYEDAVNYFYLNRSGTDIEEKYVTAGNYDSQITSAKEQNVSGSYISKKNLARKAGHTNDNAYIQSKWQIYTVDGSDVEKKESLDVAGGWYDAGEYGKYADSGVPVWTLLNIYERAVFNGTESKYTDGTLAIPENQNKISDILDEVKYEMDFFRKMICQSGEYKGMVYNQVSDFKWTGLAVSPAESTAYTEGKGDKTDVLYRILKPVTTKSTLTFAATAAQFARLYAGFDEAYSNELLKEAEAAYKAAMENNELYAPPAEAYHAGPYFDFEKFDDDFYWAACELYLSTGDETFMKDMKESEHYLEIPTLLSYDSTELAGSFNERNTQGLGSVSLLMNSNGKNAFCKGKVDSSMTEKLTANLTAAADKYYELEENQGYGVPYESSLEGVYPQGSNVIAAGNGIIFGLAYNITGNSKYLDGAERAMDYIFGRNPNECSYVTGYGSNHTTFVYNKYWAAQLDPDNYPLAPSGVLTSGPETSAYGMYEKEAGVIKDEMAPQLCYVDNVESWATNSCGSSNNAVLAWMADFMTSYSGSAADAGADDKIAQTDVNSSAATTMIYGDLNNDGVADLTDLTTLSVYLMDKTTADSIKQLPAGDVDGNGEIDIADLARFKQYICHDATVPNLGPKA